MFSRALRTSRRPLFNLYPLKRLSSDAGIENFGKHVFRGAVAAPYLKEVGLPSDTLDSVHWALDSQQADKVAKALQLWAVENGATNYCHWFHPLGSSNVRHGQSAQVHNKFVDFDSQGKPYYDFRGKHLLRGETDGSSFSNGGLRATHCAGGYLSIDTSSPIFLRGDTIFIPSCFASYHGHALDEKTPLLRAADALNSEGLRLMKSLGIKASKVQSKIGLEQELFLVHREAYLGRMDLQLCGRTVFGKMPARGQEMSDHYMAPPSLSSPALHCLADIQSQAYTLGIPLRTRHREVAPNQYELAPMFGPVSSQVDQNLMVMQIIEETAAKYGLAALLQEKPFQGVNGSGKHNNWSLSVTLDTTDNTNNGNISSGVEVNLLDPGQLQQHLPAPLNVFLFPMIMSVVVRAVDRYWDLLRVSIATPGNDFRLGACEAPPAIISMYLGDDLTGYLNGFKRGEVKEAYRPNTRSLSLGASVVPPLQVPAEDRNRTSPLPYGGQRFEFRAVGASQNVSMVNTVLMSITSAVLKEFNDAVERSQGTAGGAPPLSVLVSCAKDALDASLNKIVFNGNGYCETSQGVLVGDRGLGRVDSGVDAVKALLDTKNQEMFASLGVLTKEECESRAEVYWSHYIHTVEMEALCLLEMYNRYILPSVIASGITPTLGDGRKEMLRVKEHLDSIHSDDKLDSYTKAKMSRDLRLGTMMEARRVLDGLEGEVPAAHWTLPSYKELLFMDQHEK